MELGMISSTWLGTKVGLEEGIRSAKRIGFDTYDIFEDPLDIDDATRKLIKDTAEEVGLPIRSVVCVAFGLVDFNPSVQRFTLDRIKAYVDQGVYLGARNVLLVVGEYYWDGEVFPKEAMWDMAVAAVRNAGEYAAANGLEVVLELEPFDQALLKDVDELVRFVRAVDVPAVRANADISHLHLSNASFDDVKKLTGLIGHIHLSDCDGEVHGDLPAGRGVTPIRDYLAAIRDTGYDGTVSIELEYSPDPEKIVEWAAEAYEGTATIMRELGVR
jgi:sugar phosphate isomerase/epimerase